MDATPNHPTGDRGRPAEPDPGPLERPACPPAEWGPELARAFHAAARLRHLARRTESAYRGWIRRFLAANSWRHPATLGEREAVGFLSALATRGRVRARPRTCLASAGCGRPSLRQTSSAGRNPASSALLALSGPRSASGRRDVLGRALSASTQNQALAALLFLFRTVLGQDLPWLDGLVRAPRPRRVPVVLSRREVRSLLAELEGPPHLVATLLYGAGLRLLEALRLRVKDVDLDAGVLTIRSGGVLNPRQG